jgi:hypothetical protein
MANQTEMDLRPLVLIIDSEEAVRDLYGKWFVSLGFQVMCAIGTLGVSFALRRERPQLIITELHAKDLTLHGLFNRLRSEESTRCHVQRHCYHGVSRGRSSRSLSISDCDVPDSFVNVAGEPLAILRAETARSTQKPPCATLPQLSRTKAISRERIANRKRRSVYPTSKHAIRHTARATLNHPPSNTQWRVPKRAKVRAATKPLSLGGARETGPTVRPRRITPSQARRTKSC